MNEPTTCQKLFLILALCIGGCITGDRKEPAFYDDPLAHMRHDAAVSMNWLAIAGAVTIAFGVSAYMNGQKAAISVLAGGITLLAVGLIVNQMMGFFMELQKHSVKILIGLGIIAFFIFARTSLDVNRDGKIDWQDIKAVFFKIRRKP